MIFCIISFPTSLESVKTLISSFLAVKDIKLHACSKNALKSLLTRSFFIILIIVMMILYAKAPYVIPFNSTCFLLYFSLLHFLHSGFNFTTSFSLYSITGGFAFSFSSALMIILNFSETLSFGSPCSSHFVTSDNAYCLGFSPLSIFFLRISSTVLFILSFSSSVMIRLLFFS